MTNGVAQSVQARLVRHAKLLNADPNLVLTRYATERLLYRLSRSPHGERFVLKGALLLLVWLGETVRPTRDADFLGFGDLSTEALLQIFADICAIDVEPDGIVLDASTIRVTAIRPADTYGGQRVTMLARLGSARLRIQVDIGIGDAVMPEPEWIEYPALLDQPRPRLRAYRRETVVAEKFHAMVVLGSKNSRMRDFFDLHALATRETFHGATLLEALQATFQRRGTALPAKRPLALTPDFAALAGKRTQWTNFLRNNHLTSAPAELGAAIDLLAAFLSPILESASRATIPERWNPGGPWTT